MKKVQAIKARIVNERLITPKVADGEAYGELTIRIPFSEKRDIKIWGELRKLPDTFTSQKQIKKAYKEAEIYILVAPADITGVGK